MKDEKVRRNKKIFIFKSYIEAVRFISFVAAFEFKLESNSAAHDLL